MNEISLGSLHHGRNAEEKSRTQHDSEKGNQSLPLSRQQVPERYSEQERVHRTTWRMRGTLPSFGAAPALRRTRSPGVMPWVISTQSFALAPSVTGIRLARPSS